MKCPECGQWNRASMPHCIKCGSKLNIDEVSRVGWKSDLKDGGQPKAYIRVDEYGQTSSEPDARDKLAQEMFDLKKRKTDGAEKLKNIGYRSVHSRSSNINVGETENSVSAWEELPSERDGTITMRRVSREGITEQRETALRHKVRFMDDTGTYIEARSYDPYYPENPSSGVITYSVSPTLQRILPSRARRRKKFLHTFLILLLIGALGAGGYFTYRFFAARKLPSDRTSGVSVTASMLDDLAAHTVMIPGENGTQIYIRELHASYLVTDGFATVEVADHTWYDNHEGQLDETMEVTLTPFLKTASGKQTPMEQIHYTISIPLSPITLDTPESLRTEVSTTMATIKIVVRPGSRVTVNGNDCSDTVSSESGEMSYNATVQPIGDNVFNFVVRSQYCRDNSIRVVLYRAPQEIPLDLAVGTYGTTDQKIMKVTATTLPGSYVEVTSPYSDLDITDLDTNGKFTFNAIFDKIGNNTISISASYPGKKTSVVEHTVYYLPPASEYTVKAWPLDTSGYSELLSNISVRAARSQVYVITGIVQYSVSDKPQMVVINTSEDGKSQPVLLQNYTKTNWQVGSYYRIYADAYSTYNGMPWLNARYTYTK